MCLQPGDAGTANALGVQAAGPAQVSAQALLDIQQELQASFERCGEAEAKLQVLQEMAEVSTNVKEENDRLQAQIAAQEANVRAAASQLQSAQQQCASLQDELEAVQHFYANVDEDKRVLEERCARCWQ